MDIIPANITFGTTRGFPQTKLCYSGAWGRTISFSPSPQASRGIALVGDIPNVYSEDVPYQRKLFRFDPAEPVEIIELLMVTYGLSSFSFLTTRSFQQLAVDEGSAYALGRPALWKNFYIDNFIGVEQSIEEASQPILMNVFKVNHVDYPEIQ